MDNQNKYIPIADLTARQKKASTIAYIVAAFLGVLFLILSATITSLPSTTRVIAISIVGAFFIAFAACAIIQKNPISAWLAVAFFVPLLIEILTITGATRYAQIYPLYIIIPAVACFIVAVIWRKFNSHFLPILFFSLQAVVFSMHPSGIFNNVNFSPFAVILPISGAIIIGFVVYIILKLTKKSKIAQEISNH